MFQRRWMALGFVLSLVGICCVAWPAAEESTQASNLLSKAGRTKNVSKAIRILERSIDLNPLDAEALLALGSLYMKTRQVEKAEAMFSEAVKQDEDLTEARAGLGEALLRQGRISESLDVMREVISKEPQNPNVRVNYGKACLMAGVLDEARDAFRWIMMVMPSDEEGYLGVAEVWREAGYIATGRTVLEKGLDAVMSKEGLYRGLGLLAEEEGDLDEAILCYKKAIATSADDAVSRRMLFWCALEKKDWKGAIQTAKRLKPREKGKLAGAEEKLAKALAKGKPNREAFTKTLKGAQDAELLMGLGLGLMRAELWDEASVFLDKAARLGIWDPSISYHLGRSLANAGRYEEAEQVLFSGLSSGCNPLKVRVELAKMHLAEGDEDRSISDLMVCLDLYPVYDAETVILKECVDSQAFEVAAGKACDRKIASAEEGEDASHAWEILSALQR